MGEPELEKPSFISSQVKRGRYVFVDLNPRADAEFTLVCAGWEECTPDYQVSRSAFRYHAVEYVVDGQWELDLGGKVHEIGPGAVFSYGPNTRYSLRATGSRRLAKFFVDFAGRRSAKLLKSSGLTGGRLGKLHHTRWVHDLLDQLLDCANLPRASARRIGTQLTELLLSRLHEDLRAAANPHPESFRTFERVRQYVQEHYVQLRTVEELASHCNVVPAYLSRLFRRFADESPLQYLTRLKMDHAAELILRQNHSVKQAAAALGFDDPYHFSRVFKRVHGVAPGYFGRK